MAQEDIDFTIRARQEGVREAAKSLEEIEQRLNSLDKATEGSNAQFAEMAAGAVVSAAAVIGFAKGVYEAVQAVGEMVLVSAKAAEQIQNMAATTGFGVEQLQVMKLAAQEAGVGLEAIESGALKLERALETNAKAFAKYGLDANQLMAIPAGEAFERVIKHISEMGRHTEKVAAINDLFGRGAAKALLPLIDAMEDVEERARLLGVVMGEDQVAALGKLDDAADDLSAAWEGLLNQFSAALATEEAIAGIRGLAESVGFLSRVVRQEGPMIGAFFDYLGRGAKVFKEITLGDMKGAIEAMFGAANVTGAVGVFEGMSREAKEANQAAEAWWKRQQLEMAAAIKGAKEFNAILDKQSAALSKLSAAAEVGPLREWAAEIERSAVAEKRLDDIAKQHTDNVKSQEKAILALVDAYDKWADAQARIEEQESERLARDAASDLLAADEKRWRGWITAAGGVADLFSDLSSDAGDFFDRLSQGFAEIANALQNVKEAGGFGSAGGQGMAVAGGLSAAGAMLGPNSKAGGALSGAGRGAAIGTMILPGWGTAIGAFVGGIAGWIGAGKKQAEELKRKQAALIETTTRLMDAWRQARTELAEVGASGVNKVLDYLGTSADATAEQLARGADYVAASFAMLRAAGLTTAQALAKLKPSLDALSGKGALAGTAAEPLVAMANFAAANAALLDFVAGLGEMAQALAGFGMLTQELATKISLDMGAAIQSFIDKGLTYQQALALSAQDLYNLDQAAKQSGTTLDEHTRKLVEDAKAAGLFEGLEDPMKALVEINKGLLEATAELVKLFGGALPASVQKLIDEFNNARIPVPSGGSGGGTAPPQEPGADNFARGGLVIPRAAAGLVVAPRSGGSLVRMGEAGGAEVATPVAALYGSVGDSIAAKVAAAIGDAPVHVHVYVGGQKIDEYITRGTKTGQIRVHRQAVRVF